MNVFGRLIVVLLAVFLLIIYPCIDVIHRYERRQEINLQEELREFVDGILNCGRLSIETYEQFESLISRNGKLFDINIMAGTPEVIKQTRGSVLYDNSYNPANEASLVLVSSYKNEHHEHSADCYYGSKHVHEGDQKNGGGCYQKIVTHTHNSNCYEGQICSGTLKVDNIYNYYTYDGNFSCSYCGKANNYSGTTTSTPYIGCMCVNCGKANNINTYYAYTNYAYYCYGGICRSGSTASYDITGETCGRNASVLVCTKSLSGYEIDCNKSNGHYYYNNGSESFDETYDPKCNRTAVNVQPLYEFQVIEAYSQLNTDCIITFLDGHKELLICLDDYSSGFGLQKTELSYSGLINTAKNYGRLTAYIDVNTLKFYDCDKCNAHYQGDEDGNDPGCFYCENNLKNIMVKVNKSEYLSGEELDIVVSAVYENKEEIVSMWTSNYNAYAIGEQRVTISYSGKTEVITIKVVYDSLKQCTLCQEYYDINEYYACPSCSEVISDIEVYIISDIVYFSEDIELYIIVYYNDGSYEYIYKDYETEGFNKYSLGRQSFFVKYKGFVKEAQITVVENEVNYSMCKNGHVYMIGDECIYCEGQLSSLTSYLSIKYHDELIIDLYQTGNLIFDLGTYICVELKEKDSSYKQRVRNMPDYQYQYGGVVR